MMNYRIDIDGFWTHWYKKNKLHRIYGPAFEYKDCHKVWHVNGEKHRLDGPAIEWHDGRKFWYIDSRPYNEEEFKKAIKEGKK